MTRFCLTILTLGMCVLCVSCGHGSSDSESSDSPVPSVTAFPTPNQMLQTDGLAPSHNLSQPTPIPTAEAQRARALASQKVRCRFVQALLRFRGTLFIGCNGGAIVAVGPNGRVLRSTRLDMYIISAIEPAGSGAVAVNGWNDGAALRSALSILRTSTLKPVVTHDMPDTTYLGTIGDRAFVDDWCCNGRPGEYLPATIYSISLSAGTESQHVDLTPDPRAHPADAQPLGQGEWNYMIGTYIYVVVGPITYRYDARDLTLGPTRLSTQPRPASPNKPERPPSGA